MTIIHEPMELENSAVKDTKAIKVLLTGTESNRDITLRLSEAGFEVDFLPMELKLKDVSTNFSFKHFQPGINYAHSNGHDLVICLDEESHKIGVAVKKNDSGVFQLLNAHQLAALLVKIWQKEYPEDELVFVKSFHISEMIELMAAKGNSTFKNIVVEPGTFAQNITALSAENEGKHILGFTENQEFFDCKENFIVLIENIIRFEEQLNSEEKTLFDALIKLYQEYGFYKEKTFVVEFTGQSQRNHVQRVMSECKKNAAAIQERLDITHVIDFKKSKTKNFQTNKENVLKFPSVNMLQIKLAENMSVTIVPQEQQVYYYFSMKGSLAGIDMYPELNKDFDDRIFKILEILNKL